MLHVVKIAKGFTKELLVGGGVDEGNELLDSVGFRGLIQFGEN